MKGNLIGEQFDPKVSAQIYARQNIHGSGFAGPRSPEAINLLNNKNAWLKMASSVYVVGDKTNEELILTQKSKTKDGKEVINRITVDTDVDEDGIADGIQRLKDIGIPDPENFIGNLLAQQTVLFNTLSTVNPSDAPRAVDPETGAFDRDASTSGTYNFRSGVTNSSALWNNNSYGLGGTDFGLSPAPGLIDASIECVNRGSIRKAKVTLKAYNKFQFELIELVYMRLGFSVMLEWGWDKFIGNDGSYRQTENTIIEDIWFSKNGITQVGMIEEIKKYRELYDYNYDAFFGKVANFDWTFNSDGTYDIGLDLITIGDVIESLDVTQPAEQISQAELDTETEDGWFSNGVVFDKLKTDGEIEGNNIIAGAGNNKMSYQLYADVRDKNFNLNETDEQRNFYSLEGARAALGGSGYNNYKKVDKSKYNYFMTLGQLMTYIQQNSIQTINSQSGKSRKCLEFDSADYNCFSVFPNVISLDPKVCLIKPMFFATSDSETTINTPQYLEPLKECITQNGDILFGRIMNIYVNYEHIAKLLSKKDGEGKVQLFKFLETLCSDINSALGNVCNLEPILKDDYIVTIIDQNPIPGLIPYDNSIPLEVFGYDVNNNTSNFVTDIKFNSKITPKYATQISIGATGGTSKTNNEDGTAFSKWNQGLIDRFAAQITDARGSNDKTDFEKLQEAWDNSEDISDVREALNVAAVAAASALEFDAENTFTPPKFRNKGQSWGSAVLGAVANPFKTVKKAAKYVSREVSEAYEANVTKRLADAKAAGTAAAAAELAEDGRAKNVKYLGETYDNLEKDEWFEKGKNLQKAAAEAEANAKFSQDDFEDLYSSNYNLYLIRAFGGTTQLARKLKATNSSTKRYFRSQALYTKIEDEFISQGKAAFKAYMKTETNRLMRLYSKPSGKIGFIPVDLSLTLDGMAGMLIYNSLPIRQDFLPKQYDKALKFVITKVNHKIADNTWETQLNTLATSPVETFPLGKAIKSDYVSEGTFQTYEESGPIPSDQAFKIVDNRRGGSGGNVSIDYIVSQVNDNLQPEYRKLFNALNEKYPGYTAYVNAIGRTFAKSAELQSQGANAAPGRSKHNYYGAIDMNISDPNGRTFMKAERKPWIESGIVSTAKSVGFEWGGNFSKYVDSIHFYTRFNIDTAYLNAQADNAGKNVASWETKGTKLTESSTTSSFNYQQQFATVTKDPQNPRPGQTVTVFINYNDGQGKIAAGTGTITIPVDNSRQSQTTRNAINAAELQAKGDVENQLS